MATTNIKQQVGILKIALTYLLDHYHFQSSKAVGHSNGGLVLAWFIGKWLLEKKKVTVSKLAIIGSPYQFNQEMFDDFQKWKSLGKEVLSH